MAKNNPGLHFFFIFLYWQTLGGNDKLGVESQHPICTVITGWKHNFNSCLPNGRMSQMKKNAQTTCTVH